MVFRSLFGVLLLIVSLGAANAQSLTERLAAADPGRGERVFKKCRACHTVEMAAPHRVGPNLWGVIGRPVATMESYGRYSKAMKNFGGAWDPERLDVYLENPRGVVPGTIMTFAGLPKPDDRANVIAYLNQNGPEPLVFGGDGQATDSSEASEQPAVKTEETASTAAAPSAEEADYGFLVHEPGVAEVHAYCTPCHSEMIVVQQGKTRDNWEKLLKWMIDEQGMAPIDQPDLSVVLDYLAANYNEDRPNFPRK